MGDSDFTGTYHGAMQSAVYQQKDLAILYDADHVSRPDSAWFSPEYWSHHQPTSGGRGASWFIQSPWGEAVLKHYRRGGWMAKLLHDRYVFQHWSSTRSWREWRVLEQLSEWQLPVPQPWVAWAVRRGWMYRCGMITARIPHAVPLSRLSCEQLSQPQLWRDVGASLQLFCRHGVSHADLNLSNILRDRRGRLYWIDFDRARVNPRCNVAPESQARRLMRSYLRLYDQAVAQQAPPLLPPAEIERYLRQSTTAH